MNVIERKLVISCCLRLLKLCFSLSLRMSYKQYGSSTVQLPGAKSLGKFGAFADSACSTPHESHPITEVGARDVEMHELYSAGKIEIYN